MSWKAGKPRNARLAYNRFLELRKQHGDSLTNTQVAEMLDISEVTVVRYNRKAGIKKTAPYKGFPSGAMSDGNATFLKNNQNLTNKDAADLMGVSEHSVVRWRALLGLSNGPKGKWSRTKHPKGYLGHTHGEHTRAKISKRNKETWARPDSPFRTEALAQFRSDRFMRMQNENRITNYSRSAAGKRPDLGQYYFRSAWEANYARYLNFRKSKGEIVDWQYEPDTFWFEAIKRGTRSYKPDFKVFLTDGSHHYVELKGWMDAKSQTKLKRMAIYYPEVRIELVTRNEYRALRAVAPLIPNWEWDSTVRRGVKP